jgi:hypothetical protein
MLTLKGGILLAISHRMILCTVILNGIFGLLIFCGEILFRNRIFAYHWSSYASRISKKLKKAKEIFEGRTKGQIGKKIELS